MDDFELRRRTQGSGVVISVSGELDLAVAEQLQEAIDSATDTTVVVDLGDCEFIDSTGIAVLVRGRRRFAEEGRLLVVAHPQEQVMRVFEITGLTRDGLLVDGPDDVLG